MREEEAGSLSIYGWMRNTRGVDDMSDESVRAMCETSIIIAALICLVAVLWICVTHGIDSVVVSVVTAGITAPITYYFGKKRATA